MNKKKPGGSATSPDMTSESIVAFYLTLQTNVLTKINGFKVMSYQITDPSGVSRQKRALRVTFPRTASIEQPVRLLTLVTDQTCNVVLTVDGLSPAHCTIYAQLNSGPCAFVLEDYSTSGTGFYDNDSLQKKAHKTVHRRRRAAQGLHFIKIGPAVFECLPVTSREELAQRDVWFKKNESIPVTITALKRQLGTDEADFHVLQGIGEGGNGTVYKQMENNTGLLIAVKEVLVKNGGSDKSVREEIEYSKKLSHARFAGYLDDVARRVPEGVVWCIAMPLYQGSLWSILPLQPTIRERVMSQATEGVQYMHNEGILHRDLKPDNILIRYMFPPDIVIGDFGWATSLLNFRSLRGKCGTTQYSAPETFQNAVHTTAIDVFSLGATFFSMLQPERVKQGCIRRGGQIFNTAFENVVKHPPQPYASLVQSMMASDLKERASLNECLNVIRGKKYNWKKRASLAVLSSFEASSDEPRRSQRLQNTITQQQSQINKAYALQPVAQGKQPQKFRNTPQPQLNQALLTANDPKLPPIPQRKQPEYRPIVQRAPAKSDFKVWDDIKFPRVSQTLHQPAVLPPRPFEAARVQGVDFTGPPPANAAANNPFADRAKNLLVAVKAPTRGDRMPTTHEPSRTPIRKPDTDTKRYLRRCAFREYMVKRYTAIRDQYGKFCRGVGKLGPADTRLSRALNVARGLTEMTTGGFGMTKETYKLVFNDWGDALNVLRRFNPQAGVFEMTSDHRLIYGLQSRGFEPLTMSKYQAERQESRRNLPFTSEGREIQAKLKAIHAQYRRDAAGQ